MKTPNIDNLASNGVRFDKAYTCQPVCSPARSSILTGNYPHTTGVWGNNMPLGENIRTIGRRLKDNKYTTAYIGKWHLSGTNYFDNGLCPPEWDPDYWYDGRCWLRDLEKEGRVPCGESLVEWVRKMNNAENIYKYGIEEDYTYGHRCSDRAISFLEKNAHEYPFFLVVSYDEPHGPCTCPPPFCDIFKDFEYELGENVRDMLSSKPQHQREWAQAANLPKDKRTLKQQMYFGCNSYVDYEIGRVLDAIEKHGSETLVVFTSDHGTPLLSHGLSSKGPAMYDETTRIPFIVRWKGHTPDNLVCGYPVSHISIAPTLLHAAGLSIPPFVEGHSIFPTIANPDEKPGDIVYMEFSRFAVNHDGWGGFQPIRCVFDGRYKLVVNLHYTDELYDLENDPQEMHNLIESVELSETREVLHNRIIRWMNETRDPFRGPIWERRPWKKERQSGWRGPNRERLFDGYDKGYVHLSI